MSNPMYGFVLLPDQLNLRKIVDVNNKIFPHSPLRLDKEYTLPHCTVLQAPIRINFDHQTFLNKFKNFYGFKHEPQTKLGNLYQDNKTVLIDVVNARWLSDFNEHMVHEVASFIDVPSVPKNLILENEAQKESYNLTGYKRNLSAYSPHFTVAVDNEEEFEKETFPAVTGTVRFRSLAFCKHGNYGKIEKVISSVQLPFQWD
jgi:hypothetical protein